jgi:hypothetical protein
MSLNWLVTLDNWDTYGSRTIMLWWDTLWFILKNTKRQKRTYQSPSRPARSYAKCSRGIHASTCKDFWLKSITFLPVAAGKNLINCYSIYILKMGRIYIKTVWKFTIEVSIANIPLLYRIRRNPGRFAPITCSPRVDSPHLIASCSR